MDVSCVARLVDPPGYADAALRSPCSPLDTPLPVRQSALCISSEPAHRLGENGAPFLLAADLQPNMAGFGRDQISNKLLSGGPVAEQGCDAGRGLAGEKPIR